MAETPFDPGADDGERRLHPWSWMFVLLTQLGPGCCRCSRSSCSGAGASWELYGALGAVVLALYSLVYSIGFRYRIGDGELVVREGILFRSERHIPFARAQNIVQKRNPLHRWFEVTELRLESAGGSRPEAVMNVISRAEAERLVGILRGRGETDEAVEGGARVEPALALDHRELFRLGLVSNRGWLLVGALMALLAQGNYWDAPQPWSGKAIRTNLKALGSAYDSVWHALSGPLSWVLIALACLVLIKLLSIVMAFVTFHGFRLTLSGERIATESGLLVRQLANARREKIQRLLIGEGWLARRFGRRWLQCEIATGAQATTGRRPPRACAGLRRSRRRSRCSGSSRSCCRVATWRSSCGARSTRAPGRAWRRRWRWCRCFRRSDSRSGSGRSSCCSGRRWCYAPCCTRAAGHSSPGMPSMGVSSLIARAGCTGNGP
jgi:putative membrane protein